MNEFADETAELASYRGQDFLTMYLKACGKTDIPTKMHEWIGLSLLAGLVQDRITVTLNPHWAPFTLLLYIMLISKSGAGKGLSISGVEKLIKDTFIQGYLADGKPQFQGIGLEAQGASERTLAGLHLFKGRMTRAAMEEYLSDQCKQDGPVKISGRSTYLYWLAKELKNAIGQDKLAQDVLTFLVDSFEENEFPITSSTRKSGPKYISKPCINFLASTSWDWMPTIMSARDAAAGLMRRFFFVDIPYDPGKATLKYDYSERSPILMQALRDRVASYASIVAAGEIRFSPVAWEDFEVWFHSIQQPIDVSLEIFYGNRGSNGAKLAALSALSRWDPRTATRPELGVLTLIEPEDVVRGAEWWTEANDTLPKLLIQTGSSEANRKADIMADMFTSVCNGKTKTLSLATVSQLLSTKDFDWRDINNALETLAGRDWVTKEMVEGRPWWTWEGRKGSR